MKRATTRKLRRPKSICGSEFCAGSHLFHYRFGLYQLILLRASDGLHLWTGPYVPPKQWRALWGEGGTSFGGDIALRKLAEVIMREVKK